MSLKARTNSPERRKNVHSGDGFDAFGIEHGGIASGFADSLNNPLFAMSSNQVGHAPAAAASDVRTAAEVSPVTVNAASAAPAASSGTSPTTVIAPGATVELSSAYSGDVSFAGDTGTLKIDNSSSFTGTITGQLAIGDVIDLADITAGADAKISYTGNNSPGTLTVSDGTHTASIALTGNYSLANFTASSDGKGGTNVVDPPITTVGGFPLDANGLPIIAPQANSRVIYVSSSTGSDSGNGLTPGTAVKTIAEGLALMRNGSPDQLLLKAGDTFVNQAFGYLKVSGQSASAPMVIGTYGTGPAPIVETPATGDAVGIGNLAGRGNFLVVEGINFYAYTRDPSNSAYAGANTTELGTNFLNTNQWVLLAGNKFSYYTTDIVVNSGSDAVTPSTVTLYRNVVTNAWSATAHSQGLYVSGVGNLVIQQNIFDHNGWNSSIKGAEETIFNRNVYLQSNNGPVVFTDNISTNSSSEGAQFRSGGTITGNLFVADSAGFSIGENPGTSSAPVSTIRSTVATGNVILESGSINTASGVQPRGDGILVMNAAGSGSSINISNNIVAHPTGSTVNQSGISLASNTSGVSATNNILYDVAHAVINSGSSNTTSSNTIDGTGYLDPNRSIETYDKNVLGGPGTLSDFLARAEANPGNPALTAAAVIAYIQQGFNIGTGQTGGGGGTGGTTAPKINSVVESPATGKLNAGDKVTLTLNLSSAVTIAGGTPTLTLNDGGTATYTGGSGSGALTFTYTVAAGQNTSALAATGVNLNGATIKDGSGNAANVGLSGLTQAGPQIDTTMPAVSTVVASGSGITSGNGILGVGKVVTLTVNVSEAVTISGGTPTLTLNDGGTATYTGGSGTSALTFSYTVAAGQSTADLAVTGVNMNSATVKDGAGNGTSLAGAVTNPSGTLQIGTTGPSVSSVVASGTGISSGTGTLGAGKVVTLTVNLNEAVTVAGGTPTLTLNDGGTATYTGGSGTSALTFSYTVGAGQNTADLAVTGVSLNSATVKDSSGNTTSLSGAVTNPSGTLQIDTAAPSVSSVAASGTGITSGNGNLGVGKVVTLTVNLNEAVTVAGGTPTLTLNDGGTATYTGGSGTSALTFSYTVGAGQNTADLAVTGVSLNSATVKDSAGNSTSLSGAATNPSGTLQISGTGPAVSSVAASGTGINSGNGTLGVGKVVTLTVNLNEAVTVTGGTPTLNLNNGGTATYTGGSGTSALTFKYTVAAGQSTADLAVTGINLNSATVKDGAGNTTGLSGAVTNPSGTLQIDTSGPAVSSVVASGTGITAGSGNLGTGKVVTLTVNLSEAVTVSGGTPTLTLNDGGKATYTGGSGTNALTFSYTVGAGESTNDLAITGISLNSATVKDSAGNTTSLAGAVTNPSGTLQINGNGPLVSSVATSGTGIAAGSGNLDIGSVVTLTVNLNEVVTVAGGTPTLKLNNGGTATYTGGSGTSKLTFSYTVGAGQNTGDLAVTGVNLNSATVTDSDGNSTSLSGAVTNPSGTLQIDTSAPSVSSVVASGTGIKNGSGDLGVGQVVTLTVNLNEAVTVSGGTPTLTLNDGGTATYTGGSGTKALTFSYTVAAGQSTADLAVTGVNMNSATVRDGAGNTTGLAGAVTNPSGTLQISGAPPSVSSVAASGTGITAGSGDLGVGSVVTLTVKLSGAVTVKGGTPTLTLNDGGTATYTGGSGTSTLTFSYKVAAGQNTSDLAVTAANANGATIKDAVGNVADLSGAARNPSGTLHIDTTAHLTQVGNQYFLQNASGKGPSLKNGGSPVTDSTLGTWNLIAAAQVGSGYQVALKSDSGQYTVWNTDGQGNVVSNGVGGVVSGTNSKLEALETTFGRDLNGDGTIGLSTTVIESSGSTALAQVGDNYFFNPVAGGTGPEFQYNGSFVTPATVPGWTFIAAEKTSTGYEVALKATGSNQYTVWNTDNSGKVTSNAVGGYVSGSNAKLQALETSFHQDLNGDGKIGVSATVIESSGSTALAQVGDNFFFNPVAGGTGPEFQYAGSFVTPALVPGWTFIGAEKTSTGYEVALKATGSNQYTVWNTDNSGKVTSNAVGGIVSGSNSKLQALEASFHQDLNGDGIIFISGSGSSIGNNSLTVGNGATVELTAAYSGTVSFAGATGTLKIDDAASFTGKIAGQLPDGDVIDLANVSAGSSATVAYSGNNSQGTLTVSDGTHTANIAMLGNYTLANFHVSSDGNGGTSVVDPPVSSNNIASTSPLDAALNQRLALFSQHISSAFPSSGFGDGARSLHSSEVVSQLSQLARSVVGQHAQA